MQEEENIVQTKKPKRRRVWKIIRNVFLGILLFLIFTAFLLRFTIVQTYLANQFSDYLSSKTNTEISIGRLDISGLLSIKIHDLFVIDQEDSVMVDSKEISIDVNLLALLNDELHITNVTIDSTYFALLEDHRDSVLNLVKIIDYFGSGDTTKSESNLKIKVDKLHIKGAHYVMDIWSSTNFDDGGMNYTHLDVKDVDLIIDRFYVDGDTLFGNMVKLKAYEKCGFDLQQFGGEIKLSSAGLVIHNFNFRTPSSWAYADFEMRYKHWPDWLEFLDNIRFNTQIDSAQINLEDIQYFATSMKGMQDTLLISGNIRGPISNLKLRKGKVYFKKNTHFIGDITMTGLPDIEQSFMLIKAKDLTTSYYDLHSFLLPDKKRLPLPEKLKTLGNIQIKGRFTGFYNDFVSKASYKTKLGLLTTDILLKPHHNQNKKVEYHGRLTTTNFHLGALIDGETYGGVNLKASIDGFGLDQNAQATYKIDIASIYISKYQYQDVLIDGKIENERIDAKLISKDGDFKLEANGSIDFHDSLPAYQLRMNVKNARIARLFLLDEDTLGRISGKLNVDMQGDDIDNINGVLSMDSIIYSVEGKSYQGDSLSLRTNTDSDKKRVITLNSKWVDADIKGQFLFSEFKFIYHVIFKNILPSVVQSLGMKDVENINHNFVQKDDYIEFRFDIKNPKDLNKIFLPKSKLGDGTIVDGFFALKDDSMRVKVFAPSISYDKYYAENLTIELIKPPHELNLFVTADYLKASKVLAIDSVEIHSNIASDTVVYYTRWGKKNNQSMSGFMGGSLVWLGPDSMDIAFAPGEIWLNDTLWKLSDKGRIQSSYHYLNVKDFSINSKANKFAIQGSISEKPNDILEFDFKNFDLSLLDFYLVEKYSTDLDGRLTGHFELSNIWTHAGFTSEMQVTSFFLNQSYLGNATAHSSYSRSRDAFVIDVVLENPKDSIKLKYLDLGGFYYPKRKENNFDLNFYFNQFPLHSLNSYLTSFTSDIEGTLDGKISIDGSIQKPILSGSIDAKVPKIKIDYINETYHFDDKLVFTDTYFGLDDVYIYDKDYTGGKEHRALANIQIRHQNYSNFELYVDIKPNKLAVLDIKKDEKALFYGKAKANGDFKLFGPFNKMTMRMDLESLQGSKISIPFSSETVAEEADFITFVHKADSTITIKEDTKKDDNFSLDMDMTIKVKPSTQIEIVMDEVVGDKIMARGDGTIRMVYDRKDNFTMFGKYTIERGDYLFTMQNIINKHFIIEPDGYLEWNGNPEEATINVKAIYKTEAKLYDLIQQVNQSEEFKKRSSKVECIINITGNIYSPDVKFDIKVPEESSSIRELVKQLLTLDGTSGNSQELNKNFISLLVLSRFQPPSGYDGGTNPDALSKNATEMVANQVGNILNKLSDDVEIGLDWNPGDELTTQEVAIALSYSMLDDRLVIDGKFGTGGGSTTPESAQRIVGDLNVEYKITKDGRIRGKVFNRTNYDDPVTKRAPYTQGVGIAYRKEFDNLYELFHRTKSEEEQIKRSEASAKVRKEMKARKKERRKKEKEAKVNARKPKNETALKKPTN
ncbi:MAG: translocation/assembly module TamB domain-containing protein [Bacteroidales bacterium]|nr:translocation/assembly module TamB domain-containing protein [Bacteroidales bacterium]